MDSDSFNDFSDDSIADRDYVVAEDSSENEGVNRKTKGKKRRRFGGIQEKNKKLKDSGEAYKSYRGKGRLNRKKTQGNPCICKLKCFEKIPETVRAKIFSEFWGLKNHDLQNSYLFGCMEQKLVKRKTKKMDTRRSCTISYKIKGETTHFEVCKQAFISIHGIGRGRSEYLV